MRSSLYKCTNVMLTDAQQVTEDRYMQEHENDILDHPASHSPFDRIFPLLV